MTTPYSPKWYNSISATAAKSASVVVPIILELLRPQSVVDVGCGTGEWLATFSALGVKKVIGIDGEYVDRQQLKIPVAQFVPADLTKPLTLDAQFDLAVCLEVGEHLPAARATDLVSSLCRLAPVVLFSAAIPYQGGNKHINEQWPGYWQALFAAQDYVAIDCLRRRVWDNPEVMWYYTQNSVLYVNRQQLPAYPKLEEAHRADGEVVPGLVHPNRFVLAADLKNWGLRGVLPALPSLVGHAIRSHWRRWVKPAH